MATNPRWPHPGIRRKLAHHQTRLRRWSTAVFANNKQQDKHLAGLSHSSVMYEKYRDELEDYVTVDY